MPLWNVLAKRCLIFLIAAAEEFDYRNYSTHAKLGFTLLGITPVSSFLIVVRIEQLLERVLKEYHSKRSLCAVPPMSAHLFIYDEDKNQKLAPTSALWPDIRTFIHHYTWKYTPNGLQFSKWRSRKQRYLHLNSLNLMHFHLFPLSLFYVTLPV